VAESLDDVETLLAKVDPLLTQMWRRLP